MKKCKCTVCGQEIDLRKLENLKVIAVERGYKYPFYEYFTICPKCCSCHELNIERLPFLSRVCLKFKAGRL